MKRRCLKKILAVTAASVFAIGMLAGCGSSSAPSSAPAETPAKEETKSAYEELQSQIDGLQDLNITYVSSDVSDYPTVKVYFTVENMNGETIELNNPKAAILETVSGGEQLERVVKSTERLKGNQGISFDLIADKSDSMVYDLGSVKTIMTQFVDALDYESGDRAEFIAFDSYVMYMCTYTNDATLLKNGINNMTTYGFTALYDALFEGVTNAGNQKGAKCVIAFTDGMDNESSHTPEEIISLANAYNVPVFIVGAGDADSGILMNIANSTGGQYWDISSVTDLNSILTQIYTREKDMYCLTYTSDASIDAYTQRTISCVLTDGTYGRQYETSFTPVKIQTQQKHDSRYEVIKADCSWTEANAECIKRGGHLVTLTSKDEMDQVSKLCEDQGLKYVWMGGYTLENNGSVYGHWVTGEDFNSYSAWYPGEPSRNDKDGAPEMYLMLWNVKGWSWNDQRNDPIGETGLDYFKGKTGYVCEYES